MQPPIPKKVDHIVKFHGDEYNDPFHWMRYIEEDKDVKPYVEAENKYTEEVMAPLKNFREKLFQELKGRHLETYTTSKYPYGPFLYYSRYEKGKEYAIHCRQKDVESPEEIILDENELAKGQEYFELGAFSLSPNHELLAYSFDNNGSEKFTVHVKNLKTGDNFTDEIKDTSYGLEWYSDNQSFTFVKLDENLRPYQVRVHTLGNKDSRLLHEDNSGQYFLSTHQDLQGRYTYIGAYGSIDNTIYYTPQNDPKAGLTLIQEKIEDKEYYVDQKDGDFFIRVNDTNSNFRIVKVSADNPSKENWQEVIPSSDKRTIVGHSCFKNFNVYCFRENGLKYFEVHLNDGTIKTIPFPADAYQAGPGTNYNFDTEVYRYNYSALNQPPSVYDYHVASEKAEMVYMKEVPNFNPDDYEVERAFAPAEDGSQIPMSIVFKKGLKKDGSAPAFLYGYGSYGACIDPSFVDRIYSFVDRGFVFALGHPRGSSTMGRKWYEDGKFLKKKNTFTDFRDCAKFLIDEKYSSKGNISISGGSAGGLLMGATMNLAPELFKSVVAAVPFVDVLNTMLDSSLPLTKLEYKEWGNPEESKEYYDYIKSYSPYDNIEKKAYPHLMCTGGLNDPRVTYWEPTKFVAKMREEKTNDTQTLLKINMGGGHFGASGRFEYLKEYALEYAFILSCHGITE